ncbi:hypothetical protein MPC4_270065 [Methylocella tundrae]|uniref:Uncharacterized protein n=1 Tax=Methylocella tundrae TaxID=227605 RepID=A0A8B6M9I1_METTU|nr:hypothetical protein MPC4_270065 [Methylocella tundrae]
MDDAVLPFSLASLGQRKSARRIDAKSQTRLLTVIRGSEILEFAKTREGLPELRFGGLFLLPVTLLIAGSEIRSRHQGRSLDAASNSR